MDSVESGNEKMYAYGAMLIYFCKGSIFIANGDCLSHFSA